MLTIHEMTSADLVALQRILIRFYEKQGFIAFSTHVFHMVEDPQTDILMRKLLA